jgi:hypothetical protein
MITDVSLRLLYLIFDRLEELACTYTTSTISCGADAGVVRAAARGWNADLSASRP